MINTVDCRARGPARPPRPRAQEEDAPCARMIRMIVIIHNDNNNNNSIIIIIIDITIIMIIIINNVCAALAAWFVGLLSACTFHIAALSVASLLVYRRFDITTKCTGASYTLVIITIIITMIITINTLLSSLLLLLLCLLECVREPHGEHETVLFLLGLVSWLLFCQ